nr:MAG TPA: stabilization protein [Bacteriophage sp.]
MDLNPISQPNNSLSDCLNGTIITYDGNEFNLQNDFGNYSLKNCSLQQGFVPVGMKSYGDIIYIASCSKDGKLCELGTYPSPKYPKLDELDYSTNNQAYAENLELENNYKPLWNYSVNGTRQNFTTGLLNFDLDHPVNIEIQPSYDGSVNLILNDNKNEPRLINSGFSIYENRKARLVKRNQKEATNLYLEEKFKNQIRLKKVVEKISRFELLDVPSTGQLKGGNYTFYLKMADGDYNKSDIVAESGQISIFKGNSTSINSIHGTLLNETTDKAIQLRIDNIDTSFSNFYILYSREFSDLNGVRQYETFELTKPFEINNNDLTEIAGEKCFTIQINGTEQTNQISEEEINIEYIPINAVKTQAQQQNMLFLGNIKSEKTEYKKLQDIAYNITVQLLQNTEGIG